MSLRTARAHARNANWPMVGVEALPEFVFASIYRSRTGHDLTPISRGRWQLVADGERWELPRAKDALRVTHIGTNPSSRTLDKYLGDEVVVQEGATVVDVGAMIGEFSRALEREFDATTIAVEPDARNAACLRRNIDGDVIERAAWIDDVSHRFVAGEDSSESSILDVDSGRGDVGVVDCIRLDELQVDHVNLLKIEAEGAEPEALLGARCLEADQVVVDVSPERGGVSPATVCRGILESWDYDVTRHDDDVLVAVQRGVER